MFMCEHRTRDMVWRPELMEHPNGARGLAGIVAVRSDPEPAARAFARLFALGAVSEGLGRARGAVRFHRPRLGPPSSS